MTEQIKIMTDTVKLMYQSSRENANLKQNEAVYHLDIKNVETLSRYENGHSTPPDSVVRDMSILYKDKNLIVWHLRRIHPELSDYIPYPLNINNVYEAMTRLSLSAEQVAGMAESLRKLVRSGDLSEEKMTAFKSAESEKADQLTNELAAYKLFLDKT